MQVKVNNECVPVESLISVEDYAKRMGCTRANVYYHIREKNIKTVKIANTNFVIIEK